MEEEREPLTQTEASSTSDSPTKGTLVLTDSAETSLERKDLIQDLSYSSFSFISNSLFLYIKESYTFTIRYILHI